MNLRMRFYFYSLMQAIGRQAQSSFELLRYWPWRRMVSMLKLRFHEDQLALTAGSLTFTTTIALVPMMTVMLAVFTAFPMFGRLRTQLEGYLVKSLVPASIAKPILQGLTHFADKASRLGTLSLVMLVISALMLMLTIDHTLNRIWRVRKPRPIAQRILVYWAAATLGPLVLAISLWISSYALAVSQGWIGVWPAFGPVVLGLAEFITLAVFVAGVYRFVPNTYVGWRQACWGGVLVALVLELAKRGLALYFSNVPVYSTIYGAFSVVPIFLIWIYLTWVIVLLGAVFVANLSTVQKGLLRYPDTPGWSFNLGLQLVYELNKVRAEPYKGWSLDELAGRLKVDPLQIESVLETFLDMDWVGRLDEIGAARFVLLVEPVNTLAMPMIARLLLSPTPVSMGFSRMSQLETMSLQDLIQSTPVRSGSA